MPIKNLPYDKLEPLIVENLSTEEWQETIVLIKKMQAAKNRGWLTKKELVEICYWKSPRAIWHIKSNNARTIKKVTENAFNSRSEQVKIDQLTFLKGVSLPMASSILMLTSPKRYGVIDIRVWELMFHLGVMQTNQKGTNFSFKEWFRYLIILRYFANKLKVTARDIERTLFNVHKKYQTGQLYKKYTKK